MDNLFGKYDSGNDSDSVDNGNKLKSDKIEKLDDNNMDIEDSDIKPEINTNSSPSKSSPKHSDSESLSSKDNNSMNNSKRVRLDSDASKSDDLNFNHEIVLPQTTPIVVKERRESKEKNRRELEEEEREKMRVLVSNFTEDQLHRYEMYRRAAFPKAAIKRIMQTITGCSVSQNVVIAMSGIAKVYVGEIVEEALDVMEEWGDTGPLQPKHLREAVRKLRIKGKIPIGRARKAFFRL